MVGWKVSLAQVAAKVIWLAVLEVEQMVAL